uniref:Reverse transcriptase N-terminal domain-containing protein n=1 Tax=Anotrichium furcellatum TaxID=41999 RepID=A0A4D6WRL7_9FLOR|nr:hypothetical protein [Anotrichium furcellatum]
MLKSWMAFPWNNFYTRILNIQIKILKATKSYNQQLLYKLQNYLFNSIELRIICIEYIIQKINSINKLGINNIYISNKQKILIFKLLFNVYISPDSNLYFILENVKQNMIYYCIKPEWQVKIYSFTDVNPKFHISKLNAMYCINYSILNKIKSFKYFNQYFKYCYYNHCLIKCMKTNIYNFSFYTFLNNHLINILLEVYFNYSSWLNFFNYCLSNNKYSERCFIFSLKPKKIYHSLKHYVCFDNSRQYIKLFNMNQCFQKILDFDIPDIYNIKTVIYKLINNQIFVFFRKKSQKFTNIYYFNNSNLKLNKYVYLLLYNTLYYFHQ